MDRAHWITPHKKIGKWMLTLWVCGMTHDQTNWSESVQVMWNPLLECKSWPAGRDYIDLDYKKRVEWASGEHEKYSDKGMSPSCSASTERRSLGGLGGQVLRPRCCGRCGGGHVGDVEQEEVERRRPE